MEFKRISDLSFFSNEQKEWFKNYIIYTNGDVVNGKTDKPVAKTVHGTRGYVVNLSIYVDSVRKQRQIVLHKAMADLFIRPIVEGEKLFFKDGNKLNVDKDNLEYEPTIRQKKLERTDEANKKKGITESGRICSICKDFKEWDELSGGKRSSICKPCASKRGVKYQQEVKYSERPVRFETYAERLKTDDPINVDGKLGFECSKCNKQFLLRRSKVLSRVRSKQLSYNVKPLVCDECIKGEDNEPI